MASVSTYLNFPGTTEEAFNFYKTIFGGEFDGQGIMRMGDVPADGSSKPLSDQEKNMVMHVSLKILNGHQIMGTDAVESMGFKLSFGNNMYINLEPDSRAETDRLFNALSESGKVEQPLAEMFWGDYFGSCKDKFGVQWMFNCASKE